MKTICLFLAMCCTVFADAQTFTIIKDEVLQNKKVVLKIVKLGAGADLAFNIKNPNDEELVSVTKINVKAKNGASQYMVTFTNGQMGIATSDQIVKNVMIGNLFKTKAIVNGQLTEAGVSKYYKQYLVAFKETTEEEPTTKTKKGKEKGKENDSENEGEDDAVKNNPKELPVKVKKQEAAIVAVPKVVEEPLVAPVGAFEERDISKPILARGKTLFQDNFILASYASKIVTEKGQKLNKVQFKNYKGKFVAEITYIKGETSGSLYNALDKERTDIDVLDEADEQKLIVDLAGQLLDLEIL